MGKGAVVAIVISLLSASAVLLLTKNILSPSDALEDASTYANINEIQTEHFHMDIAINFNRSRIEGKQHLYMMTKRYGVNSVTLDIRGLDIYRVSNEKGENLSWKILPPNPNIASARAISTSESPLSRICASNGLPTEGSLMKSFLAPVRDKDTVRVLGVTHPSHEQIAPNGKPGPGQGESETRDRRNQ